ncbi:hypothetical protein BAOM_3007 [Peribacillus asahii]|uniref:Uncharacterized protein n=1 Tax=Peribacillus asahii TaxID=228899 RepID=A0A3Q9RNJ4_9BACI|nr:hypothetical protein [Peribacillus asahii]AZV43616.1 hypothetical protein BAOM_3007 [Peribacillus asahii]
MKISEMIEKLQRIKNEYGDLEIYEHNDWTTLSKYESGYRPRVSKIYYQKWEDAEHMQNELSEGNVNEADDELFDVDISKPIILGVTI